MISDTDNSIVIGKQRLDYRKIVFRTIKYIDDIICKFPLWLENSRIPFSSKEDMLNPKLAEFLNISDLPDLTIENIRFSFTNQPAQPGPYTPDIGVSLMNKVGSTNYFFYLEGKRLPARDTKSEREYVYGNSGGIQRFKENKHGSNLPCSAMIGYIQKESFKIWQDRINGWIDELIKTEGSQWNNSDKMVVCDNRNDKFRSEHNRTDGNKPITLYHYWIDLTNN